MHIRPEHEPIQFNHGCIKPGFSTDNYSSIDQKSFKWHVFEDNAGYPEADLGLLQQPRWSAL